MVVCGRFAVDLHHIHQCVCDNDSYRVSNGFSLCLCCLLHGCSVYDVL